MLLKENTKNTKGSKLTGSNFTKLFIRLDIRSPLRFHAEPYSSVLSD